MAANSRCDTPVVQERKQLEEGWAGGGDVSTESLRVALQRYREFFQVLLRS